MNLGMVPSLMRVGVFLKKFHEWIEPAGIKVISKKKINTRVISESMCVIVGLL